MNSRHIIVLFCGASAALAGCAVPQPLGRGVETVIKEPRIGAEYYQYLPEAYVKNNGVHPLGAERRWPLVVTFHGMKPYDSWDRQIHEWQEQADAYGFVVVAPWLQSCDSFMEFPLRKEHDYVLRDKQAVMAVLDHVLANTRADPKSVLSTSWSSGGFMAHYFPNRYPHRFTCVATRLSNFSPDIMIEETVPLYRSTPVALFIGESDFPACISQSQEAAAWYKARGFTRVESKMIDSMGHRRIPQTAAAFFARQVGVEPLNPEVATRTLAEIRMHDWEPTPQLLAAMAPRGAVTPTGVLMAAQTGPTPPVVKPSPAADRRIVSNLPRTTTNSPTRGNSTAARTPTQSPTAGRTPALAASNGGDELRWTPLSTNSPQRSGANGARATGNATKATAAKPLPIYASSDGATGTAGRGGSGASQRPQQGRQTPASATPPVVASDVSTPTTGNASGDRMRRFNVGKAPTTLRGRGNTEAQPPKTVAAAPRTAPSSNRVNIKVTAPPDGMRPLYVAFSTDLPAEAARGANFLWSHNGTPVCDTARGARILDTTGVHTLSVLIIARDGKEYRGSTTVQVRESALSRGSTGRQIAS